MRRLIAFLPLVAFALTSGAHAADMDPGKCNLPADAEARKACVCVVTIPSATKAPVAVLQDIRGDVMKSGQNGFSPVTGTAGLHIGDKVLLSSSGQALLVGMTCSQAVGPNASLIITQINDICACAALEQKAAAVVPHDPGILAAALGAGTIAGLIGLAGHPHPASP